MTTRRMMPVFLFAALLGACGGPATTTTTTTPARTSDASAAGRSTATASETTASTRGGESEACTLSHVYFEYDSNTLDRAAREALVRDAACLRERTTALVTLVGGADERGTEEYNLSLGDRRARAVRAYLTDSGVEQTRLNVSTMGEEWATGTDEASMVRDRRVEPRLMGSR